MRKPILFSRKNMVHVTFDGSMIGSAERFLKILPRNEAASPGLLEVPPQLAPSPGDILICNESNVIAMCHEGFLQVRRKFCCYVMCMVNPSGHGHIVATENLGICTSRGSHAVTSQNTLMICDTVGWNFTIWNMASGHCSTGCPAVTPGCQ
jgi:hypothetical protein